jgi:hypothetical protein
MAEFANLRHLMLMRANLYRPRACCRATARYHYSMRKRAPLWRRRKRMNGEKSWMAQHKNQLFCLTIYIVDVIVHPLDSLSKMSSKTGIR